MNDDELEAALRHACGIMDPVPSHLLQAAVEAYALSMMGAELAELAFDSFGVLEEPVPVRGVGGHAEPRLLTFHGGGLTVDLELTPTGAGSHVVGQIFPAGPARVELDGRTQAALGADALGRFTFDHVPSGPFSLRCHLGGTVVATEWITA
jgi:hypothetical protein